MLEAGQLISEWLPLEDILPGIERGDLLEFRRTMRIGKSKRKMYTHWAIYIGKLDGTPRVIHISTPDGDFELFTDGRRVKDSIAGLSKILTGSQYAEVRCDSLEDVAGDDLLRINNGMDNSHRPFPPSIIVERATQKLGEGNYNVVTNNCEHFCKYCRYGNKISSQAVAAKTIALSSLLAVGLNPGIAIGAGILFAATSNTVSQYLHRRFSTNFRFF